MIIRSLEVVNFRNFAKKKIEFCNAINVLYGLNGAGKTNTLEAIAVVCLSRSFRTRADRDLPRFQQNTFRIKADILFDTGNEKNVQVNYDLDRGKEIFIDQAKIKSLNEVVGFFPIVILAPEDDAITDGEPRRRRRFLDLVISQRDKSYLRALQDYQRILKQRNKILHGAKENRYGFSEKIDPWNEALFDQARIITDLREDFLNSLEKKAAEVYHHITSHRETLSLAYQPSLQRAWGDFDHFRVRLNEIRNLEIMYGHTLVGPHRDEIIFLLNGWELRKFGSRGQHRSVLVALKIAEFDLLQQKLHEKPVFLMDDVYSEIDDVREKALNDYFLDLKQIFLTTHENDDKFDFSLQNQKQVMVHEILHDRVN